MYTCPYKGNSCFFSIKPEPKEEAGLISILPARAAPDVLIKFLLSIV